MLIINSFIFLFVTNSGGEYIISNLSITQTFMTPWFTIGMSLFIFSMGFSNLMYGIQMLVGMVSMELFS